MRVSACLLTLTREGCLSTTCAPSAWRCGCLHCSGTGPGCDETGNVTDDSLVQMYAELLLPCPAKQSGCRFGIISLFVLVYSLRVSLKIEIIFGVVLVVLPSFYYY